MGNISDVGLCQEVADWQRRNRPGRDPQTGCEDRSCGLSYLQNEHMLEWRPTKATPSGLTPGPPRAGTSRNRASSMFVTPTRDMLGQDWVPGGYRPQSSGSRPPDRAGQSAYESFGARGPMRQHSAGPGWGAPRQGPLRQQSAPVRRYGPPTRQASARSNLPAHAEEDDPGSPVYRFSSRGYDPRVPQTDRSGLRGPLPPRPRTPRGRAPELAEGPPAWEAWDPHPPCSETAVGLGSRRREDRARGARNAPEQYPPRVDIEDTKMLFGEKIKRSVAQATPKEEERQAEADLNLQYRGGPIIATIQKGFEGIFGHLATSKEEVLKKRGPMQAPDYEAVPGDDIDQRVQYYAKQLPVHVGDCLKIYRISKGEYQIGSDEVHLAWQSKVNPPCAQNPTGSIVKEVFVFSRTKENDDGPDKEGKEIPCEPLPFYLRHSANVAYDLQYGSKVMKVPQSSRLSFAEERGTLLKDGDADAKYNAMTLATQQAKKREQAAMEWRKRNPEGMAASASSRDSPTGRSSSTQDPQAASSSGRGTAMGSPPQERPAPGWSSDAAVAPPGPIPGLDPPQLKLPPPPPPLQLSWGQADARKALGFQPPPLLSSPQGRPLFGMSPFSA